MEKTPDKVHDFIVERSERTSGTIHDLAVLLTDVRGGKVRIHLSAKLARQFASDLAIAIQSVEE